MINLTKEVLIIDVTAECLDLAYSKVYKVNKANKVNTVYSKTFSMIYIYLIHYKSVDVLNQPYTVIDRNIVIQSHRITI